MIRFRYCYNATLIKLELTVIYIRVHRWYLQVFAKILDRLIVQCFLAISCYRHLVELSNTLYKTEVECTSIVAFFTFPIATLQVKSVPVLQ